MEAKSIEQAAGAEVVALGANAAANASVNDGSGKQGGQLALLGYLLWFSVAEAAVRREDLISAIEDSGLPERFAPGDISARDAFRRATSSLALSNVPLEANCQSRLFGTELRHANFLIRDVRKRGKCVVRQVVREVVDAVGATLDHKVVGQLELSADDELRAFPLAADLLDEERGLLAGAEAAFEEAKGRHDSGAVRRVISRALSECHPVVLRASGGVYFIPVRHEPTVRSVERFVGEVRDRLEARLEEREGVESRKLERTLVMAVELVDREEYRDAIAASLDEQVDREANALIKEMADVLKRQRSITKRRQEDFFSRVRDLKRAVSDYEALLEREVTDARANLELAQKEAVSMLSKIEVR
jgi:hypothetical protein